MLLGGTLISSVEFHGNMSLVIFMAKCPLRCPYCHNVDILEEGTETSLNDIKNKIKHSSDFIDAVNISGGEPLFQLDETIELLKFAKSLNLKTKIDTSGSYPKRIEKILNLGLVDYIALDVKAPFNKYMEIIGSDIGESVKESMNIINKYDNVTLEVRTTFVPNLITKKDIQQIASTINADIYTLQQFRNNKVLDESLNDVEAPNPHDLKSIAISLKPFFKGIIKVKSTEFGEEEIYSKEEF
jgi:pyruvate formate lyase activating enzyme